METRATTTLKVIHVINGLNLGGSETMLVNVIKHSKQISPATITVVTFGQGDYFVSTLKKLKVEVVELPLRSSPLKAAKQFFAVMRKAEVVCSWSYHSHLLTFFLKIFRKPRLIWFIRHADVGRRNNKFATWVIMRICAALSPKCDAVVFNGNESREVHTKIGFHGHRMATLPNGCDTKVYSPDSALGTLLIEGMPVQHDKAKIILSAARWHPIKDHATFITAFARAKNKSEIPLIALLCGKGIDAENLNLVSLLDKEGLIIGQDVFLLGQRDDLAHLLASCDIYVMHSASEAFPNTLVQAMSAGARVVSTDVGSASQLSRGAFKLVEPGDCLALADEILKQAQETAPQVDSLGRNLRQIIIDDYSIMSVIPQYEDVILG